MPVMDGWEFRRRTAEPTRPRAGARHRPVSVGSTARLHRRCRRVSQKPVDFDRLIRSWCASTAAEWLNVPVDTLHVQVARLRRLRSLSATLAKVTNLIAHARAHHPHARRCRNQVGKHRLRDLIESRRTSIDRDAQHLDDSKRPFSRFEGDISLVAMATAPPIRDPRRSRAHLQHPGAVQKGVVIRSVRLARPTSSARRWLTAAGIWARHTHGTHRRRAGHARELAA